MARTNYSHQREAILNFLKGRQDHPTADIIYNSLRETYPNLSLGTVYRNLTKLTSDGTILKISCNDTSDHFDGNILPHGHFICRTCKKISDLSTEALCFEPMLEANQFGGKIECSQIIFYGQCPDCINT